MKSIFFIVSIIKIIFKKENMFKNKFTKHAIKLINGV